QLSRSLVPSSMSRQFCSRTAADCIFPSRGTARAVVSFAFGLTCTSGLPPYITEPFGGGLLWAHTAVEQASTAANTTSDLMSLHPVFDCASPLSACANFGLEP